MPAGLIFHKGDTLAFYGFCNDGCRHFLRLSCFCKSIRNLIEIMSVDFDDVEVEGLKLIRNRIGRTYILDLSVNLKSVVVYDDAKVVEFL